MSDTETSSRRAGGQSARGRVLLVMCDTRVTEHELPASGSVVVGRGADADIVVDHKTLSRAHAKLSFGAHVTISDCGSRNGTVVAGRTLKKGESVLVAPGSPIELGDALLLIRSGADSSRDLLGSTGAGGVGNAGKGSAQRSIEATLERIARSQVAVLLVGEAGTGKAHLAARVHGWSDRLSGAIVTIASTHTTTPHEIDRAVAAAHRGTLLVREPSLLSRGAQVALDAALAAGGTAVRTVTLTTRDLHAAVAARELEASLLHRLAGVSVVIPPLRARIGELDGLADALLAELATEHGRPRMLLSADGMAALSRHSWPGNVRELRNVLATAVLLGKGRVITSAHLDLGGNERAAAASGGSLAAAVDEAEHRRILDALRQCNGNQTRAAKSLGISRGTLIARLERFGVPRPRK